MTVLDRLELPASLGEFHAKLRTALETLVRDQGLEVIAAPGVSASCRSASCGEESLRASGASHVLFVEGNRNDYGFSLDITLRSVAGDDNEKAQGWCNFCTGPQMVTAAENVARPLVVHLAARPERAPGGAAGAGATPALREEPAGGSAAARVVLGAGWSLLVLPPWSPAASPGIARGRTRIACRPPTGRSAARLTVVRAWALEWSLAALSWPASADTS